MNQLFTMLVKHTHTHTHTHTPQKAKTVMRVGRVQIAMGNEHLLVQVVVLNTIH